VNKQTDKQTDAAENIPLASLRYAMPVGKKNFNTQYTCFNVFALICVIFCFQQYRLKLQLPIAVFKHEVKSMVCNYSPSAHELYSNLQSLGNSQTWFL